MKVLMISGDRSILDLASPVHARLQLQESRVDQLDVFVWPQVHGVREIMKAAKKNRYDVVTAQDPFWRGLLALYIARRTKAKLNLQIHTDLSAQSFWRRSLAYFLLRRADSVRVVSQKIKDFLAPLHSRATISILPVYVNLAPFYALSHRPHPRFKKVILWVGRFEPEKDPMAALQIFLQVCAAGIPAGLILLGAGSLAKELRANAKEFGPSVEFPGWRDPAPYLEVADVVVNTSKHESYGASILEALAARVPVVSPDVGVAKEAGAIVVPRPELASAVVNVLNSGQRGELKIHLPSAEEWAKRWRETLA